jgi:hypothetical protein
MRLLASTSPRLRLADYARKLAARSSRPHRASTLGCPALDPRTARALGPPPAAAKAGVPGLAFLTALAAAQVACGTDNVIIQPPPPPPAEPPGTLIDAQGEPPSDWVNCGSGHFSLYFNLADDEASVGAIDPDAVPFWFDDHLAYSKYDVSLEFGPNWWPVDEGLAEDPRFFAAQWTSWLRVFNDDQPVQIVLAAETDVFVTVADDLVIARTDVVYEPEIVELDLNTGVYPVTIRYVQRTGVDGGFRFRVVNPAQQARICWPEFPDEER